MSELTMTNAVGGIDLLALIIVFNGVVGLAAAIFWGRLCYRERRRLRDFAAVSADWFWETDAGLRPVYVSDRFFELTGNGRERRLTPAMLGLGEMLPQWREQATMAGRLPEVGGAGDQVFVAEVDITGPNGITLAFTVTARPVRGLAGRFRGLRGSGTNVSDSKRFVMTMAEKTAQFRAAIATMPNGIAMFDDNLRPVVYNQSFLELWDISEADLQRYPRLPEMVRMLAERGDYGPGDVEQLVADRLRKIITASEPSFELQRPNGRILEVRCHGRTDVGYVLTYLDVTERRRAEQRVRESELRLRRILEESPVGISIIRPDCSHRLFINRRLVALHGGGAVEEFERVCIRDSFVSAADFEETLAIMARGASATGLEVLRRRRDGSVWWSLTDLTPLTYEGGPAYIAWHYDITERKRTERALHELDERLQFALHNTRACVWDLDRVAGTRWYSEQVRELVGYGPEDLAECRFAVDRFIHPGDRSRVRQALRRHFSGMAGEFRVEYRALHHGGHWIWLETIGRLVRDETGQAVRFIGTFIDITARRRTEAELMRSERMAALGRLVAGIAHEINNPIGIGVGVASSLQERAETLRRSFEQGQLTQEDFEIFLQTLGESCAILLTNLQRGAELVRSFKQVAVDQSSGARREVRLGSYIEELLRSLRPKFRGTEHSVQVTCPEDLTVVTNPGAVSQILTNFIENSLVHGFENLNAGKISIEVLNRERALELVYRDNGCGMTPGDVEQIFEPFFTTKRGRGGSGLGMHVVFNLVTQTLGGSIMCESHPGEGVMLRLMLPLADGGAT